MRNAYFRLLKTRCCGVLQARHEASLSLSHEEEMSADRKPKIHDIIDRVRSVCGPDCPRDMAEEACKVSPEVKVMFEL